jgi:hypothetical protein
LLANSIRPCSRTPANSPASLSAWSTPCSAGGEPEINDTTTYDNGVKVVPSYLLEPVSVDREQLGRDPDRQRLLHGNDQIK